MQTAPNAVEVMARRFEFIPSATIFDVMDGLGLGDGCCLSLDIRPLVPDRTLAGPAYTVRWVRDPRRADEWNPPEIRRISNLFEAITPGDVIVVDGAGDRTCGHWGEMLSMMARNYGARGVVVDGGTRDSRGITRLEDWSAWARYTAPVESMGRLRIHELDVPVSLAAVRGDFVQVDPGDWIVADDDAVLVVPRNRAEEILVAAEALEEVEEQVRLALLAREDVDEVFRRFRRL